MTSYLFDIGGRRRKVARFLGRVRQELVAAFIEEHKHSGLTRDMLARKLDVHKSVVTRRLNGSANLTLRSVAEVADALGREINFSLEKPAPSDGTNIFHPKDQTVATNSEPPLSRPLTNAPLGVRRTTFGRSWRASATRYWGMPGGKGFCQRAVRATFSGPAADRSKLLMPA